MFDERTEECVLAVEQIVIGYKKKGVNPANVGITIPNVAWAQALYLHFYFRYIIGLNYIIEGEPFSIEITTITQGANKTPKTVALATNLKHFRKLRGDLYSIPEATAESTISLSLNVQNIRKAVDIDKGTKEAKRIKEEKRARNSRWMYAIQRAEAEIKAELEKEKMKPEKGYFTWDEAAKEKTISSPQDTFEGCTCEACKRARGELVDEDPPVTEKAVSQAEFDASAEGFTNLVNPCAEVAVPYNSFEDEARTRAKPERDMTYEEWRAQNAMEYNGTVTGRITNVKFNTYPKYTPPSTYTLTDVSYDMGVDKQEEPKQAQETVRLTDKENKLLDTYTKQVLGSKARVEDLTADEFRILMKELKSMPPNMKANLERKLEWRIKAML